MRTQTEASEHHWLSQIAFIGFTYKTVEISVNTFEDERPFSFSNEKFILGYLEDKYFLNFFPWLREENNTIYHQHICYRRHLRT